MIHRHVHDQHANDLSIYPLWAASFNYLQQLAHCYEKLCCKFAALALEEAELIPGLFGSLFLHTVFSVLCRLKE